MEDWGLGNYTCCNYCDSTAAQVQVVPMLEITELPFGHNLGCLSQPFFSKASATEPDEVAYVQ
eukprot:2538178-Amphidinium_carterae.1